MEYATEKETFRLQTESVGLERKIKRGDAWWPLRIGRNYYKSLNQLCIEVYRLKDDDVERFQFNRVGGKWMLTEIDKKKRGNMPNGDFLNFYAKFMADTVFQGKSLAEPLKVILTSDDGEEEPQEEFLTVEEWFEMRHSLPLPTEEIVNVDYGQACISQNKKTLLLQGISNGMQMKFKFNKQGDDWKLMEIEY